jgi:hypothetical protein
MSSTILLIENKFEIRQAIERVLGLRCILTFADNLVEACLRARSRHYSMILISSSWACEKHRDAQAILYFTCRQSPFLYYGEPVDLGALKARPHELLGHVETALGYTELRQKVEEELKTRGECLAGDVLLRGGFRAELQEERAYAVGPKNELTELSLTPTEFKLLVTFMRNEGRIFKREDLEFTLDVKGTHLSPHVLNAHICSLRRKMGERSTQLKAVLKKGYYFVPGPG